MALTYVTLKPSKRVKKTFLEYVQLIIKGLREHNVPEEYIKEVKGIVSKHSPRLTKKWLIYERSTAYRVFPVL